MAKKPPPAPAESRENPAAQKARRPLEFPWKKLLLTGTHDAPKALLHNAMLALRLAPEFNGVLRYNEFTSEIEIHAPTPWGAAAGNPWSDTQDSYACAWLQHQEISVPKHIASDAIDVIAKEHMYHPVKEYLNGLTWDGQPRLTNMGITHFNALSQPKLYVQGIVPKWMISAVARILQPGTKADHLIVLEGPPGWRKSTAAQSLVPDQSWFTDDLSELGSKDSKIELSGIWIAELSELSSMQKLEIEKYKAYISRRTERYVPKYGKRAARYPRQCVFIGTTNERIFLKDPTGNRRYWPLRVSKPIDPHKVVNDRNQLWAEAVARYLRGEIWHIGENETELLSLVMAEQELRTEQHPWIPLIAEYIADNDKESVTPEEIFNFLEIRKEDWPHHKKQLGQVMNSLHWKSQRSRQGTYRQYIYVRIGELEED